MRKVVTGMFAILHSVHSPTRPVDKPYQRFGLLTERIIAILRRPAICVQTFEEAFSGACLLRDRRSRTSAIGKDNSGLPRVLF